MGMQTALRTTSTARHSRPGTSGPLTRLWDQLGAEAEEQAGDLSDFRRRAALYLDIYRDSGCNHVFPLIAAHGAIWASDYFKFGERLGQIVRWQFLSHSQRRRAMLQLDAFANVFRNINRLVFMDTYRSYKFASLCRHHPGASAFLPAAQWTCLRQCLETRDAGRRFDATERKAIFKAFFINEQDQVVGPEVAAGLEKFDWPMMKWLALRPRVRFSYFRGASIQFHNFADREQRIQNGLRALEIAEHVGWEHVEKALQLD